MQFVTVGHASNGRFLEGGVVMGQACKKCARVLQAGQRVMRINAHWYVHVTCLREMVRNEPDEIFRVTDVEVESARRELWDILKGARRVAVVG